MAEHPAFNYWRALAQLILFRDVVTPNLDIKLELAIARCKWATAWTGLVAALAIVLRHPNVVTSSLAASGVHVQLHRFETSVLTVALTVLGLCVTYGFLRLYTLVHHVMVTNIFKCRGQRLRLLNFYGSILPLSVPLAIAHDIWPYLHWLSAALTAMVILYIVWLHSRTYNVIFHKRGAGGLWLFMGGTLVTWFVLCIGALGIAVTFAVLSFFMLVLLRLFTHH
jgi:hypothetical protein